jgi:hypothetical protein
MLWTMPITKNAQKLRRSRVKIEKSLVQKDETKFFNLATRKIILAFVV